jgi:hypothetical protein
MSETALRHVEHLAVTIGPRGSTTEQETKAHDYCQATLEGLGYEVHRDSYFAPTSGWHAYALAEGLMLVSVAIFWLMGRGADARAGGLAAAALGLITTLSFLLQVSHRPNPLESFVPADRSQNVWAVSPASDVARQRVVFTGHVDTSPAALAMQSPALWQAFQALTLLGGLVHIALVGIFIWGIFTPDPLPRTIALVLAIVPLIGLVFTVQPSFAKYVPGANDNATGAAAVLAFAERLKANPLRNTTVFLVNTGCEEVGCAGLIDWIKRHSGLAANARYLVLDNIGGKGSLVNYVVSETLLLPVMATPALVKLAESVAQRHPELGAKPFRYRGLFSELSIAIVHGQQALGLLNFDPVTKMPPNFHTTRDDMSNVDPAVLERSEQFAWAILEEIDRQG